MRSLKKGITKIGLVAAITAATATTAFAGTWQNSTQGWIYLGDDGLPVVNQWVMDDGNMYAFDENGYMRTGWMNSDGLWYFLDTRIGGPQGGLMTGWQWIDGHCYYMDPLTGVMAAATITPDGYLVDASGAWINEYGIPYYEEGKGISSTEVIDINDFDSWSSSVSLSSGNIYDNDYYWYDYDDDSVSYAANDLYTGNYGMMSSSEKNAVDRAIKEFKDEYITSDMSDFEKELAIVQWIVENCEYKSGSGWTYATAYSCIVGGRAQCSGYADAFLQMADACGLTVRYVHNSTHAWNMIKLDGDWYHVDVTWEDPVGSFNDYGFGNLRNMYINLTDSVIKTIQSHKTWSSNAPKANGTKYGPDAVYEALKGFADTVEFTVNYVDVQGNVVGVQTGTAYVGYPLALEYPDGYEARNSNMPEMHVISGTYTQKGTEITPTSNKPCEINITVISDGTISTVVEETVEDEEETTEENAAVNTTVEKKIEEEQAEEQAVIETEKKEEKQAEVTETKNKAETETESKAETETEAESKAETEAEVETDAETEVVTEDETEDANTAEALTLNEDHKEDAQITQADAETETKSTDDETDIRSLSADEPTALLLPEGDEPEILTDTDEEA